MPTTFKLLSLFLGASLTRSSVAKKDIVLETFGDPDNGGHPLPATHSWFALTDPVMGGVSVGTATALDGLGIFVGEVKDVPSLSAPGFIAMQTRGGWWPDLSSCEGLQITSLASQGYTNYKLSFGTTHVTGNSPYARGYKAPFEPGDGVYTDVMIPFTDFSDNWDAATGEILQTCESDNSWCPDDETLRDMQRFEIMAEGALGKVDLKIRLITAVGCDDGVVEVDPNPDDNIQGGRGQGGPIGSGGGSGGGGRGANRGNGFSSTDVEFVGNITPEILDNGDIRIESWPDPRHAWFALNDPVMGGQSTSTVDVKDDVAVFTGEVVDVPFLQAPGFIKMETRGGEFPDVSHCKALKIKMRTPTDYSGLHVTFGVHHAEETMPFVRGYKAPIKIGKSKKFGTVKVPFEDFSDNWDPKTGEIVVECKENSKHCPDEATLRYMTTFSIMGEGEDGEVHVEVMSIDATDCEYEDLDTSINAGTWVGIAFGFIFVGIGGFYLGRRSAGYLSVSGKDASNFGVSPVKPTQPLTSIRDQNNANVPDIL
uniref:NADH:ubiquinone oxidoreductase intermediate-associated protein 30 domain-containing protein n=1 Tax=Chaetoceros debilis TaxID=122233 RepID=A0A7S3QB97_9STRA|mmetsp:Transcript_18595/g.27429  ORF Transcript_18595/g.27429 Transcript_18595/m.27429 type:complete len:539 (+) Transcript_18595:119-1735(+)|eukprot:CAMPEP_0194090100 /NCGR_PEP_ID=MMETSP0149-20130528/37505_1 /TAXON_ID=122233 /ORGANISM="Chaetoceros debilis, Strain MM31A-1" /LENGTH=538 /DNA_ID=CAMNT_0038774241 /DNA_START=98 /DNA_END=1714 /DNA_ORIENTATION=-